MESLLPLRRARRAAGIAACVVTYSNPLVRHTTTGSTIALHQTDTCLRFRAQQHTRPLTFRQRLA
ncbi:hypothetical protein PY793_00015 [Acetobacter fabarum]|uniref:hypothetical protein n=1 Tax=Acetobacter fabarum TaxID=483199 RepID=UPI00312B9FEC